MEKKERKTPPRNKLLGLNCCPFKSTVKPRIIGTRLIRTPNYYGQFALSLGKESPYTRLIRTPHYYGQFALCLGKERPYTRLIRTPKYYRQFALSLGKESPYTRLIRTPHYYGQFALCLGKESPNIFSKFNPLNTDTPLIWSLSMAPRGLTV